MIENSYVVNVYISNPYPTSRSYEPLLLILVRNGLFRAAENVRNSMIKSCASPHDARFVFNLLRRMNTTCDDQLAFKLSLTSYNRLLMCLSRFVMIDELNSLYLQDIGCRRNAVSYANLIHGLCEAGRLDEALKFLQMKGDNCFPTVQTYTILIGAFCEVGKEVEALNFFEEMVERGCEPNVYTYTVLIDYFCKESRLDAGMEMLNKMLEKYGWWFAAMVV